MRQFNYTQLKDCKFDTEIINYLTSIHELKHAQTHHINNSPTKFNRLIESAKIRSTEASNAIEGIRTSSTRLKQITSSNAEPRNRSEEEIAGYRDVLNLINENYQYIDITSNYILEE